jgi:pimeloyl-ACP methyl ester carboxylesterase
MQMNVSSGIRPGSYADLAADDMGQSDDRPPPVLLHGLTFDRTMWRPALRELESIDPGRRAVALDLPGHGESPKAPSYSMLSVVERVHTAIVDAHLDAPVVVGHSGSAGVASVYAAMHPTSGVISVEGTMDVGTFARMAQSLEPVLRGPGFDGVWAQITAKVFGLDELTPEVRAFVLATSKPDQKLVLGYWQDLFERSPQELEAMVSQGAAAMRGSGVGNVSVMGHDPSPENVAWLRVNLPGARNLVWPNSGHFPHLAHPHRFAELLAETAAWVGGQLAASSHPAG